MGGIVQYKGTSFDILLCSKTGGQEDENETVVYLTWIPSQTIFYSSFICGWLEPCTEI